MESIRQKTCYGFTAALMSVLGGCAGYGPAPATVGYVDLQRYAGLWHEIASNPVFFNQDLYNVTAEYAALDSGGVSVLNKGHKGSADGPEKSISGTATVADATTNAKLKVQFDMPFGSLFRGNYWIVLLDSDDYQYAVVSDNVQHTLFVLSRDAAMDSATYDGILAALQAKNIDVSRLKVTGTLVSR